MSILQKDPHICVQRKFHKFESSKTGSYVGLLMASLSCIGLPLGQPASSLASLEFWRTPQLRSCGDFVAIDSSCESSTEESRKRGNFGNLGKLLLETTIKADGAD